VHSFFLESSVQPPSGQAPALNGPLRDTHGPSSAVSVQRPFDGGPRILSRLLPCEWLNVSVVAVGVNSVVIVISR
jgi:hypothetical protein